MPISWIVKPITSEWTINTDRSKTTGLTVWQCQASEPSTPYVAARVSGVPTLGTTYPGATGVPATEKDGKAVDQTRMLFRVEVAYDSTSTVTEDPLSEPVKVKYNPNTSEDGYFKDKSGTPKYAITTAGEPFAELPKRTAGELVISLEKNVASTTNYSAYEAFSNEDGLLVNNAEVTIDGRAYAIGTLLAMPPELSEIKDQDGTKYRTLTVTLRARAGGWNQKFESRGLYEFDDTLGYLRITDDEDQPVESAWPLDEDGAAMPNPDDAGAEIELKPYTGGDFSVFV